jgi:hyperosmotically inducible protein
MVKQPSGVIAMRGTIRKAFVAVVTTLALGVSALASTATTAYDSAIQASVTRRLADKHELNDVRGTVSQGIVTLTGTVASYPDKLDAAKRARKADHVAGVRNLVEVGGPIVEDSALQQKLGRSLAYDRAGWGNVFNVLTTKVENGVVTVGGEVRTPVDKDSALAVVAHTKGVKDVIDQIKVAPVSNFDDQLRLRLARSIYGSSALSGYGLDPQAPIRILVDNGHVGLYGVVNTQLEKQIAGMRASQAFGAFSVENNLEVVHNR